MAVELKLKYNYQSIIYVYDISYRGVLNNHLYDNLWDNNRFTKKMRY